MIIINRARASRHKRIRSKVVGTTKRPRLSVYKSNTRIIAQLINDEKGVTILTINDQKEKGKTKSERATVTGKKFAEMAIKEGINTVVFDRGGFDYDGRVKAFAEGARAGGLKF